MLFSNTLVNRFKAHMEICRFDHWIKNVFMIPGIVVALSISNNFTVFDITTNSLIGLISLGIIASSNYIINELLDAPHDLTHPKKKFRPVPSGRVNQPIAYVQWIAFLIIGLLVANILNPRFFYTVLLLWIMGCVYNIKPLRTKDLPYLDVISESVNNPIRMLAGYFIINPEPLPPLSLLISYWMIGCYFMAIKRFAEFRELNNQTLAGTYRKSFLFYNEKRLIVSIVFYASTAMLFLGAFIIRYKMELIFSFPLVALVMSIYLEIAYKKDSAAQAPEKLYKEPSLMIACIVCAVMMITLLNIKIQILHDLFTASSFTQ